MSFNEFLEGKIPNYKSKLSIEDIARIKDAYDKYTMASDAEAKSLSRGLSSNRVVDYANDFEKNSALRMRYKQELDDAINSALGFTQTGSKQSIR